MTKEIHLRKDYKTVSNLGRTNLRKVFQCFAPEKMEFFLPTYWAIIQELDWTEAKENPQVFKEQIDNKYSLPEREYLQNITLELTEVLCSIIEDAEDDCNQQEEALISSDGYFKDNGDISFGGNYAHTFENVPFSLVVQGPEVYTDIIQNLVEFVRFSHSDKVQLAYSFIVGVIDQ